MDTLASYIKTHTKRPMREWAEQFGVSRPFLHSLLDGTRQPSVAVAQRIAKATDNRVPITAWPNLRAVVEAARATQ